MAKTWKERIKERRALLIAAGVFVVWAVLAVTTTSLVVRRAQERQAQGATFPTVASTTASSGKASVVEASYWGGSAAGGGALAQLLIRLSEGQAGQQAAEPLPLAQGEPLSDEDVAGILARLPELTAEPGEQVELNLPPDSPPPPRPGQTVQEDFPPPAAAVAPEPAAAGPLHVLRYAPEGQIALAPFVNVTFDQPMVALATLEALAAGEVPVRLEPSLPGTWKWLGTKTLSFEYDSALIDRLPMATEYVVTVPAGTKSATGGVLAEAVRWSFSTPPPRLIASYPAASPQPLSPVFVLNFDQRVDAEAVLKTVAVTAGGSPVAVKPATPEQLAADKDASRATANAGEGRWLAFVTEEPLPADTGVSVTVGPGTPSAEGPLVTQEAQSYSFSTYAPLRIERHGCTWYSDVCRPLVPLYIEFNNPLDAEAYEESMLRIEPAIAGATVDVSGNTITIHGATVGHTTYTAVVSGSLRDTFGQTLGKDATLTFKIGPAEPALYGPDQSFVTLDPAAKTPALSVYTINYTKVRVRVYQVQPSDWPAFRDYLENYYRWDSQPPIPGRQAIDKIMPLEAETDTLTEVSIDLSPALEGGLGQAVVVVEPEPLPPESNRYSQCVVAWVQATHIGLDALADPGQMVVWATALTDGAPLAGVTIEGQNLRGEVQPFAGTAVTGEDGTVRLGLAGQSVDVLVARQGSDTAILPRSAYVWGEDVWKSRPVADELRWYVFDDRAMYRPGEEVHAKGWLRSVGGGQNGDVGPAPVKTVDYRVISSQGNEMVSGEAKVNALGGFDLAFTLPENANLGYTTLELTARDSLNEWRQYGHSFQIQEFRRPEFEVTARTETPGPYFAGGSATVAVEAAYYAGGPLPNAEVTWQVSSSTGTYRPPNWPDFVFGRWRPWWWYWDEYYPPYGDEVKVETFAGVTDASGSHYLQIDFEQEATVGEPQPMSVRAEATVMDVNRQAWAATTTLLVHPADLYVGLHCDRTFVQRGQPLKIDIIVTDLDGNAIADRPVLVQAARMEWRTLRGTWEQEAVDVQECSVGSGSEPVSCSFKTEMGGQYQITATVTDASGRKNSSQFTRWVSGGQRPASRKVEQEEVTLVPDKESYQPGDTAQILVQSPFSPAEGLLTVSRSGILYTQHFRIEDGTATLEVPIEDKHIPNLQVQVDVVGAAARTDDKGEALADVPARPAYATGALTLSIPPLQRTLALQVTPRDKELEPGGQTTLDLLLTGPDGQPVADAELAVVVVDEAILALTGYQLADPLAVFYAERPSDVDSRYIRDSVVLANPQVLAAERQAVAAAGVMVKETVVVEMAMEAAPAPAAMARDAKGDEAAVPIRVRTDFNPLATFAPEVRTDAGGRAEVAVQVPDNLTRYRVMVVAVAGGSRFGSGEANLTARLPLMVRPSAPRFLNFGDRFELPVVVQNQTGEPLTVDVALRATNLELTAGAGQRVTVPARDRVEVRFPATTVQAGTARFQVAAVSGTMADAATVELPVYTPATTEAFATYGIVDEGAIAQPLAAVGDGVFSQFGGLEISTSSTALQALTDAVLYLVSYRFECSEQLASRILAVSALRDVLQAFAAEGLPAPEEMESAVTRDIERLQGMQNDDGGFPTWRRGHESNPFNTVHVAHALQRAESMDFAVPADMRARVLDYLRNIEDHYPDWYDQDTRQTLSAYALYVRSLMGETDTAKAKQVLDKAGLEKLSLEAVAWLWQVLKDDPGSAAEVEAISRHIANRAVETAGAANFTTTYSDQTYVLLRSDRRTDAIILEAMIAAEPESDLIPKVVNGLLAHRTQGRWHNTQENVFVLLALDRYFDTFEAQTPDFVARIWLGDTYVGEHAYRGRTTERHESSVPMSYLTSIGSTQDVIVSKEGPGRLYYRLGLRYAPTDLDLDALDMGFVVQRSYEGVDDPEDVSQDGEGVWHIKAGARVRVRLKMVADNRRYHVALVDPLPAGLEIVNPALAVSGDIPQDPTSPSYRYGWWWWGTWYEHQNMRDERAEAFATLVWEGVYDYTYIARATTPGDFVVPPAKAEEMYSPEVFGRSSSDRVVVE